MKFGGLSWRLLGGIALVVVLALGVSFWLFKAEVEQLRDEELTAQLLTEARLLGLALQESWVARDAHPISAMVRALRNEGSDVVVMAADGHVLATTLDPERAAGELLQQPEARAALQAGLGVSTRSGIHGPTPSRVVAVRVGSDLDELGIVWVARPCWTFVAHARSFGRAIALVAVVAVATILGLGLALTRRWAGLLRRMTRAARSLSEGDLSTRAEASGSDEFALLARSLNEMRQRLLTHTETIDRQRQTLEALLLQLHEGVIAAGDDGRVILINPAALRLLHPNTPAHGVAFLLNQAVEQCVPQHELQCMLRAPTVTARSAGPPQTDAPPGRLAAAARDEKHLQIETSAGIVHVLARASDLRLPDSARCAGHAATGRLIVLTDVTALRQAMAVQTDFVANASHELRTPLTSIRTAVETLLQMDLTTEGAEARPFVEVIERHSARLAEMASDLLDLSRIQAASAPPQAAALELASLLRELTARFAEVVQRQRLNWEIDWKEGASHRVVTSSHLLRLVLDNLVDNAIQFTEPGGHVRVVCRSVPGQVVFEVVDDGCGILTADQERVFERFYQVERARSGTRRGTGLGLAIVCDAVSSLGGTVRLQSEVGVGTRVTVTFPQPT